MLSLEEATCQLQSVGRFVMAQGLTWGTAGNLSVRISPDSFLITASGTELGLLQEEDFVHCAVEADATLSDGKPSKEHPLHRAVYQERPEVNAVVHASPFFSTMLACSQEQLPTNWFVEAMYYLERMERVKYFHPGSAELAQAVRAKASKANLLLLENHGVLVYDASVKECRVALQTLEAAARMFITARSAGLQMNGLSASVVADFLNNSGYKPRREWEK